MSTTLQPTPFQSLPLGSIEPTGWLRDQLEIQAEGLTGHLSEIWNSVGPNSGWRGGSGEDWERGPYYLDGLVPLAYSLKHEQLIAKAQPWIEWVLASQTGDGQFGPSTNDDWWPRMVMLKVLTQYYEATSDARVIPFLTNYFRYQLAHLPHRPLVQWGLPRASENILCVQWLYTHTHESFLLDLIDVLHQQSFDWTDTFTNFPFWRPQRQFDMKSHVVNVAMGIKEPALYSLNSGRDIHKKASLRGIQNLMNYHGQVHGMFSGDELLQGTHPSQGTELCGVVEYMFTLEQLARISGEGIYGDILEKVAYNALPATISADWHGHQYYQQPNQVLCTYVQRDFSLTSLEPNLFGLEPHFGCCTANMHQGWPKFAAHLWMSTNDGGLAAIAYAPCRVHAQVANGTSLELIVDTEYPFNDSVIMTIRPSESAHFPLKLRIPEWCTSPILFINDRETTPEQITNGYLTIDREWQNNDVIELILPMRLRVERRGNGAVAIYRGPLTFVLAIGERWQKLRGREPYADWEIYPNTPWNFALQLDSDHLEASLRLYMRPLARQPFLTTASPVFLVATGRRIPTWTLDNNSAQAPPLSPVETNEPEEEIVLVPYGCAKLRVAELPVLPTDTPPPED